MKSETIRETLIYKELGNEKADEWFKYTRSKFITHVDSFYYSVKIAGDSGQDVGYRRLIAELRTLQDLARETHEPQPFISGDLFSELVVNPYGNRMYIYGVEHPDRFTIFFADRVPNMETSEIHIQLRSENIWTSGLDDAYRESLNTLSAVLDKYGISIGKITENRIDFAWHTNYIQNMLTFFKLENLAKMAVQNFDRGELGWKFKGDDIVVDYLAFGRRKSVNAFFRIYNKSQEVIEQDYKQFFCSDMAKMRAYIKV